MRWVCIASGSHLWIGREQDTMQWDIPDTDPIQSRNIQPSDFHASEIVYVCWRVAEKHIQAHKFGEAAILLERLLASPYGCTSPELELNSRIRLAWLYSTNSSLIRVAVEHIERAWLLIGSDSASDSNTGKLQLLRIQIDVEIMQFEACKDRTNWLAASKTLDQALRVCMENPYLDPTWMAYFTIRYVELWRYIGDNSEAERKISGFKASLRKLLKHRRNTDPARHNRLIALSLLCTLYEATIGIFESNTEKYDINFRVADSVIKLLPFTVPYAPFMSDYHRSLHICVLLSCGKFRAALQELEKSDVARNPLLASFSAHIKRFIGTAPPIMYNDDGKAIFGLPMQQMMQKLVETEDAVANSLIRGQLGNAYQHLLHYRSILLQNSNSYVLNAIQRCLCSYRVMCGMFAISTAQPILGMHHLQSAYAHAKTPEESDYIRLHLQLIHLQELAVDSHSDCDSIETLNSPASIVHAWFHLKQLLLTGSDVSEEVRTVLTSLNKESACALVEIWVRLCKPSTAISAIEFSKKLQYLEGEWNGYKRMQFYGVRGSLPSVQGAELLRSSSSLLSTYTGRIVSSNHIYG